MGTISLERSIQYLSVTIQRKWRLLKRGDEQVRHEAIRFARNGIIFLASATALGVAYDYVSHANGYVWGAISRENCVDVGFIAAHTVQPDENVSLLLRSFHGENIQPGIEIDLSDDPIAVGVQEFCFGKEKLADAGIIFQARNGSMLGDEEVYQH